MSKMNVDGKKYHELAYELTQSYLQIQPCMKCNHPTVKGYCCGFCKDSNPTQTKAQEAARNRKYNLK